MPGVVAKHAAWSSNEDLGRMLLQVDDFLRIMAESTFTQSESGMLPIVDLGDIEAYMECECHHRMPAELDTSDTSEEEEESKVFMNLDATTRCRSADRSANRSPGRQMHAVGPPDLFAGFGGTTCTSDPDHTAATGDNDDGSMHTWSGRAPSAWDQKEVCDWLYCTAADHDIDGVIRGEAFRNICGQELCAMTAEDFSVLGGDSGAVLYREFVILRSKCHQAEVDNQSSDYPQPSPCQTTQPGSGGHPRLHDKSSSAAPTTVPVVKRGRGRPRKRPLPPPGQGVQLPKTRGRKKGQRSRGHHLWEFLRDLLNNPDQNPLTIRWEDQQNGVFRIIDSTKVAKLWGDQKKNLKMTYEKLSRAIRFCQTESVGYFAKLPEQSDYPKKLCFMFGPKTSGWK